MLTYYPLISVFLVMELKTYTTMVYSLVKFVCLFVCCTDEVLQGGGSGEAMIVCVS